MVFLVVRVRGTLKVKPDIKETLRLLRLNRVNHCVVIPETREYKGMLQKAKDYITWGEADKQTLIELIGSRGRLDGDIPLTDKLLKERTPFKNPEELADAILKGDISLKDIEGVKPVFRLSPPAKGGYEGIKRSFKTGGALGYRGEEINKLVSRMI